MTPERKAELRAHAEEFEFMRRNVTLELLDALDEAEAKCDALRKRVAELEDRLACELAVNVHYPDVLKERNKLKKDADVLSDELHRVEQLGLGDANRADRYLAALKAEACETYQNNSHWMEATCDFEVGGITFRVSRKPDGTTEAEEVNP